MGSSKATWLGYLKKLSCLIQPGFERKSDLLSALEYQSETLQNIDDYFVPMMKNFNIYFFWEQEKTALRGIGDDYIVESHSAAPLYDETERSGIAANHSRMVKFESPEDPGFNLVADALVRYCEQAVKDSSRRSSIARNRLNLERNNEALYLMRNTGWVPQPDVLAGREEIVSFTKPAQRFG